MHRRLVLFGPCIVVVQLLVGQPLWAAQQEESGSAPNGQGEAEPTPLERSRERIRELIGQLSEALAQRPTEAPGGETDYYLSEVVLVGEVDGETVHLKADLKATVERDGRHGIPLNPFATLDTVEPSGALVAVEDGYVWRVEGKGEHKVHVEFSVRLEQPQVGSRQLRIPVIAELPAPVAKLKLVVPGDRIAARNGAGQPLPVAWDGQRSEIEWIGLPHEGVLSVEWQRRPAETPVPARLESEAAWFIEVQKDVAVSQATLILQSRAGEFDAFEVSLPPGLEGPPALLVAGLKSEELVPSQDPGRGAVLQVTLEKPTSGPLRVRLDFTQPIDTARGELAVSGLEVTDAVSQGGYLLLHGADDLEVKPTDTNSVQQIPLRDLPQGLIEVRGGLAFRYVRQPFALSATVRPSKPRVALEPKMRLLLMRDGEAVVGRLHARWSVSVQHAAVEGVEVDLAGWQAGLGAVRGTLLDASGEVMEQLVDAEASAVDASGRMHLQFAHPVQEPLVIEMDAERTLRAGRGVAIPLPVALGGPVSDCRVAVFAGEGVRVQPRFDAMPAVVPDYFPNQSELSAVPQGTGLDATPQVLRLREARQPLAVDLEVLPLIVQAGCHSRISLRGEIAQVEQRFSLFVQNGSISELLLDVPLALWNRRVFTSVGPAEGGDQRFEQMLISRLRRLEVENDPATNANVWRVGVDLSESQRGRFEWTLRFEVPLQLDAEGTALLEIPLIMPVADSLAQNEVDLVSEAGLQVSQGESETWRAAVVDGTDRAVRLRADGRAFSIPVQIARRDRFLSEPIVISRAWLRTTVESTGLRRYQGLYRVQTDRTHVPVKLPPGALRPSVRVDGRAARFEMREDGAHRVFLLGESEESAGSRQGNGDYLLHVEYAVSSPEPLSLLTSRLQLAAPGFPGARWEDRWYWQVVVPREQHLFIQSESYYPELRWQWGGFGWERLASRTDAELNQWIQAALPLADPPASANEYLFSRLGVAGTLGGAVEEGNAAYPSLSLRTVTPPLLLLFGSGTVVILGLAFVTWATARSVPIALAAAFTAMVAASLYPLPAAQLLQSATPGLLLVGVAGLLRWNLLRRQQRGMLVSAERSSILTIPSTMAAPQVESAGSVGSTRTGPRSSVGGMP